MQNITRSEEQALVNQYHLIVVYVQGRGLGMMRDGQQFRIEQDGPEEQVWSAVANTIKHETIKGYAVIEVTALIPERPEK